MKQLIIIIIILLSQNFGITQSASVEKSIIGVQLGTGAYIYNEYKLANQIVLRSEIGVVFGYGTREGLKTYPSLSVEGRWYYNLNKRMKYNRSIKNNSGSFLSLNTGISYIPKYNFFSYGIIPTIGLRRNYWDHFSFELSGGYGILYLFSSSFFSRIKGGGGAINIRLGYTF